MSKIIDFEKYLLEKQQRDYKNLKWDDFVKILHKDYLLKERLNSDGGADTHVTRRTFNQLGE